jgi:hypothetical protein
MAALLEAGGVPLPLADIPQRRSQSFQSSVAMLIAITAIVPSIFVVIPMVIAIVVAFAWPNHAAHNKADQSQ